MTRNDPNDHSERIEFLERQEYERRHAQVRRADKRLLVLYVLLVVAFVLLAYRTQVNDQNLRNGLYVACQARQTAANNGNTLRDVFTEALRTAPRSPTDARTPEQQAALLQQLKEVLTLPVEDCGLDPRT